MLLRFLNWTPEVEQNEGVVVIHPVAPHDVARPLSVVTWNVQYAGTRRKRYFYDGGSETFADPADVAEALAEIRGVLAQLRGEGLDIALLQEVDRDSDRTGRVDQLAQLAADWPNWVSTPYFRSRFVPFPLPPKRPLGRVDLHEAILARCALGVTRRLPLPLLDEPPLRRSFNLHRAILTSRVPLSDGRHLHVGCTHLSAFSRGDGTMGRQVDAIRRWMDACGDDPFLIGGDFNLLAPGDEPRRLGAAAGEYVEEVIGRLSGVSQRVPDLGEHTYLPPGAAGPDRTLDHIFVSPGVTIETHRVVPVAPWLSDHWPLFVRLRLA
ncbi:MAG: hypothetical protein EXR69_11860 [Myxococcales bacterium]|nr:hypothetical protein [Myxococcales bacterium]